VAVEAGASPDSVAKSAAEATEASGGSKADVVEVAASAAASAAIDAGKSSSEVAESAAAAALAVGASPDEAAKSAGDGASSAAVAAGCSPAKVAQAAAEAAEAVGASPELVAKVAGEAATKAAIEEGKVPSQVAKVAADAVRAAGGSESQAAQSAGAAASKRAYEDGMLNSEVAREAAEATNKAGGSSKDVAMATQTASAMAARTGAGLGGTAIADPVDPGDTWNSSTFDDMMQMPGSPRTAAFEASIAAPASGPTQVRAAAGPSQPTSPTSPVASSSPPVIDSGLTTSEQDLLEKVEDSTQANYDSAEMALINELAQPAGEKVGSAGLAAVSSGAAERVDGLGAARNAWATGELVLDASMDSPGIGARMNDISHVGDAEPLSPDGRPPPPKLGGAWGSPQAAQARGSPHMMQPPESGSPRPAAARIEKEDGPGAMLKQALNVLNPDAYDSEDDTARLPDVAALRQVWEPISSAFDVDASAEDKKVEDEVNSDFDEAAILIDAKREEIQQRFEAKARDAALNQDQATAKKHRETSWDFMNLAENFKDGRKRAGQARVKIQRKRATQRKTALKQALDGDPGSALTAVVPIEVAAYAELTVTGALGEAYEMSRQIVRAIEIAALKPQDASNNSKAWSESRQDPLKELNMLNPVLTSAQETAEQIMTQSIDALLTRLRQEKAEIKEPDPKVEAIVRGEGIMSKEQKRDKKMFEGQQEFDFQRKMEQKVTVQTKRQEEYMADALDRITRVLKRRFKRRRERDQKTTIAAAEALKAEIRNAQAELDQIRKEHEAKAKEEANDLETERRRTQGQTQEILVAAMVIREEKGRMAKAWETSIVKDKQKLLLKSLKRVRRLSEDMRVMDVMPELKQKHSVLLYSLRMLESRLASECTGAEKAGMADGPLKQSDEIKQQLQEAANAFDRQLAADVQAVINTGDARADRAVAQKAAEHISRIAEVHGQAPAVGYAAITASAKDACLAEAAPKVMKSFLVASKELRIEASRQVEVEQGQGDASSFGPKANRYSKMLEETIEALVKMRATLDRMPSKIKILQEDEKWKQAIQSAEKNWKNFCEEHPDMDFAEVDTPRRDGNAGNDDAADRLREALEIDDLDSPTSPDSSFGGQSPQTQAQTGRTRNRAPADRKKTALPNSVPEVPATPARGAPAARPPSAPNARPATGAPKTKANGADMLSQLDALSKQMDNAFGSKNKKESRKPGLPEKQTPVPQAPAKKPAVAPTTSPQKPPDKKSAVPSQRKK